MTEQFREVARKVATVVGSPFAFAIAFAGIQNSQNHDSRALHLQLDELIRAVSEARTGLVDLENLPEAEFQKLRMRPVRSTS